MPRARSGAIEIEYEATGEGEPLLLIAGIGMQLVYWQPAFIDALVARGFRVLRYDHRDTGLSSRLHDAPAPRPLGALVRAFTGFAAPPPYTLTDMAADAMAVLDAEGARTAHLVGVSMGGMVAQAAAVAFPDRLRSLTSMMSNSGERLHHVAHPRAALALLSPVPRDRAAAAERVVRFFRAVGGPRYPIDEAWLRHSAGLSYDRGFYPRGFLRHFAAALASPPRTRALRAARAAGRFPALVVHGSADPLIRPAGGRATARALDAPLLMIDGLGHQFPRAVWPPILDAISDLAARARQGA